jgi:hypothetical protein
MPNIPAGTQVKDLSTVAGRISAAWDALNGRAFGPGVPIAPASDLVEQTEGPRQYQYPISWNTRYQPRGESSDLTPFQQLRNLARLYDIASISIITRIEEMQAIRFAVVSKDKKRQQELQPACDEVESFFAYPDKINDFTSWLSMLLRELFEIDAPTIFKRLDVGGRLHSLELVDGSTIKPILDERGRTISYQQVLYGRPFSQYGRDGVLPEEDQPLEFGPQELIYRPRYPKTDSPYGTPPAELVIMRVNTALRKQTQDLTHFTSGNIPAGLIAPPDGLMQPDQVRQFQEWFNADLQGDDNARAMLKFLPWTPGFYQETAPFHYGTEIDEWMMKITCAAYGVNPAEMGFVEDVNKANGEAQENLTYRRGIKPLTVWLKQLFDRIIQQDLEHPELECMFDMGESDDTLKRAQQDQIYSTIGSITPDEIRAMRFPDLEGAAPGPPASA